MEEKTIRLDEINLYGMIIVLLKNLWVIVVLCISVLIGYTSLCRLTYKPVYTSAATFMVSAKDSTSAYNSLTTTQSMASVFVEVFQSNVLREKIQEQMPEGTFTGTINTTTIPETNLLIVTVSSDEPATSFRALNLLIENYSSISDYLFSNAQLEVIKDPIIPIVPSNPLNVEEKYPLVALISAFISIAGIVAIYLLRNTVQTPKAARRNLDARFLRTINHEKKNKTLKAKLRRRNVAPLITNSLISKSYIENYLSLCSSLEYHMRKRDQKVVLITSIAENEGKSTVAANLALAMAEKERKVVILDCDFRKPSLHKIFEVPVEKDKIFTTALLKEESEPTEHLMEIKKYGITLGVSQNAGKSITKMVNGHKLRQLIKDLRSQADYVILDTPPMLAAADAESIAQLADTAVLVVRADYMSATSINDSMDRLKQSIPELYGIVLNNYRTSL